MIIKCLNIDLDNKEKLLKAKDEEIKGLGCRIYHAEGYISDGACLTPRCSKRNR